MKLPIKRSAGNTQSYGGLSQCRQVQVGDSSIMTAANQLPFAERDPAVHCAAGFLHQWRMDAMDYQRWLWLLTAFGLIGLGVAIAMVVKMPA